MSGPLTARREDGLLVLDFPARPARPAPAPPGLLTALGVDGAEWTGQAKDDLMVVLGREEEVTGLRPDTVALAGYGTRGTIVTAPAARPGAMPARNRLSAALSVIARTEPVSSFGGARSWICQFAPLVVVTVFTAPAGATATSVTAATSGNEINERRCTART